MSIRTILDDARILLGIYPHDGGGNICRADGYFLAGCNRKWGEAAFGKACTKARDLHLIGMTAYKAAIAAEESK